MRDLYRIMGVRPEDDATIIKRRYRELAKELHPDRNGGDAAKTAKFQEISVAYAIIGNEERRAKYDRERTAQSRGGPSEIFGPDFDDLVSRVNEEGITTEFIEDFFEFGRKFYRDAPQKMQEAAQRQADRQQGKGGKIDQILETIEDLFGINTSPK